MTIDEKEELRKRHGNYTLEQRLQVLEVLRANKDNYKKTAFQTGVNIGTLRQWNTKYRKDMENSTAIQVMAEAVDFEFRKYQKEFVLAHFEDLKRVTHAAIAKAEELLENSTNLRDVSTLLQTLYGYVEKMGNDLTPPSSEKSNNARTQINILNGNVTPSND